MSKGQPEILCISHAEDADGLTCAALLKRLKKAHTLLVVYDELEKALKGVSPPLQELYICDLNVRDALIEDILRISSFAQVTFIDHHPSPEGLLERLGEASITVIHSLRDCASVLLYEYFKEELGRDAGRMAAFAAWADQFEDGPLAEELLRDYDRQSVQLEGLLLAFALTKRPTEDFRALVVDEMSKLTIPHRIKGVTQTALTHLEDMALHIETLKEIATNLRELAYVEADDDMPIGSVAGLITDALGVNVGLCYKVKGDLVNLSIRSRRGLRYHLGKITQGIALKHGGFGGGHKRASGASIPLNGLKGFIDDLVQALVKR